MKIAMAAPYDIRNKRSWSGTPWSLYDGLCSFDGNTVEAINLTEYHTDKLKKKNLYEHLDVKRSIKDRHPVSKLGPAWMNPLNSRILDGICAEKDYDVLIEMGGFQPGRNMPPYYVYTDSSHDMALGYFEEHGELPYHNHYSLEEMKAAAEFVRPVFQNAAGVFCMSDYLAKTMIERTGVDKNKVHTVYAGANWHGFDFGETFAKSISDKKEINIILTGVDYYGKGTDIAIEAIKLLKNKYGRKFILHICGIKDDISEDDCVVSHGFVDKSSLVSLLRECDLFVLPTRFDCFGISFVEAMTFGLPCIGRNICAIPEIIDRGVNGELVDDDDPEKLAELVEKICSDEKLYRSYSVNAIEKAKKFTWQNVCSDIMKVIENDMR